MICELNMEFKIRLLLFSLVVYGCTDLREERIGLPYEEGLLKCKLLKEKESYENSVSLTDCMCGSLLPEFETTTITGERIKTSDLLGKPTLINFWFSTCPPCIDEIPGFNDLVKKYGEKSMNFISIARNSKSEIEKFLHDNPWDFKHISNDSNIIDSLFKIQFGYPTTFLLDKKGIIIKSFVGGAIGENAGFYLKRKLISSIEETQRLTPIESRKKYPRHVGDIEYDPTIDKDSFNLCNSETEIHQYFNDSNGLEYKGEKIEIERKFENLYKPSNSSADNGLINVRFVVNCKGETSRFRFYEMDSSYKETNFNKTVVEQILAITRSLNGWNPKTIDGKPVDYYQVLSFVIENGQIIDILP